MRLATDVIITIINSGHLKLKNIGGQIIRHYVRFWLDLKAHLFIWNKQLAFCIIM